MLLAVWRSARGMAGGLVRQWLMACGQDPRQGGIADGRLASHQPWRSRKIASTAVAPTTMVTRSIRSEVIEGEFPYPTALEGPFDPACQMPCDLRDATLACARTRDAPWPLDRIVNAASASVIAPHEQWIGELETQKASMRGARAAAAIRARVPARLIGPPQSWRPSSSWRASTGLERGWCPGAESNHRHCDFQSHALPTELPGPKHPALSGGRRQRRREIAEAPGAVHPGQGEIARVSPHSPSSGPLSGGSPGIA